MFVSVHHLSYLSLVHPMRGFVLPWHFLWLGYDPCLLLPQTLSQQLVCGCHTIFLIYCMFFFHIRWAAPQSLHLPSDNCRCNLLGNHLGVTDLFICRIVFICICMHHRKTFTIISQYHWILSCYPGEWKWKVENVSEQRDERKEKKRKIPFGFRRCIYWALLCLRILSFSLTHVLHLCSPTRPFFKTVFIVTFYTSIFYELWLFHLTKYTEGLPHRERDWTRIKVIQPKPANHWRQQCEKWKKSIQHFNLSPLKDVGKKGWLRSSRSLTMEQQPDNWRGKNSASNSIIRWSLLLTLCVHALSRRVGGDREKHVFVGVFKSSEKHMRYNTTEKINRQHFLNL